MKKVGQRLSLQLLQGKLAAHVGSGDEAHLTADNQHAGFMSTDEYEELKKASGTLTVLETGTDINELDPGNYQINDANGAPDSGAYMYTILAGTAGIKIYWAIKNTTGQVYLKTLPDNDAKPVGWTRIYRSATLWSGNVTDNNTAITLIESVYHYDRIRFHFVSHQGQYGHYDVDAPANAVSGFLFNTASPTADNVVSFFKMTLSRTGVDTYSTSNNVHYDLLDGGHLNKVSTGLMSVIKIEGLR